MGFVSLLAVYAAAYADARERIRHRPSGIRCPGNVYRLYLQPTIRVIFSTPRPSAARPFPEFGLVTTCVSRAYNAHMRAIKADSRIMD